MVVVVEHAKSVASVVTLVVVLSLWSYMFRILPDTFLRPYFLPYIHSEGHKAISRLQRTLHIRSRA